jgi:hypothetical protein
MHHSNKPRVESLDHKIPDEDYQTKLVLGSYLGSMSVLLSVPTSFSFLAFICLTWLASQAIGPKADHAHNSIPDAQYCPKHEQKKIKISKNTKHHRSKFLSP